MNQAILFNDDFSFSVEECAWCFTGQASGQKVTIYFHSAELEKLKAIDDCTKYDLEEVAELWLEKNELEGSDIHIKI
ncbi:hypothetical protein Q4506_03190 [Colwellia sp. 4_MG-2023]|uniref:hypothetical protein n=1 Tax=unclassified Colwellia TaxID=196834 RepID=UPI001C082000|nr:MULTISPECIES: hypothetical protein [unclassified Colwellia]MBU2923485.1 hypothetical protein [Colwellia sp. C2M11]MDO6486058.1 hypothetical protein [Colwellia sp. 6_MG-2023]MDO6505985.1 hypothetical protein [Colwellia sp. 5_MG-2023]MDO6554666.1 hypothetical protein [Colwellia sp. 4_MG-2023]MDO6653341.1 hypothetical protein [Colwellia sp. 3_MG-2023]